MSNRAPHAFACCIAVVTASLALAGPLTPPAGPPASTAKTLAEVEPRTAINDANTPGDTNSIFRITRPGSYYLTDNIGGAGPGTFAIEIDTNDVTIDLNGFGIFGAGTETIAAIDASGRVNIVIKNGSINSWPSRGVFLGFEGRISDVHFDAVGAIESIAGSTGFIVEGCTFRVSAPIVPPSASLITGCRFLNMNDAIQNDSATGVRVLDTVIDGQNSSNDQTGVIRLGDNAALSRVTVNEDGQTAAWLGTASSIVDCTFTGTTTGAGSAPGVRLASNCVIRNTVIHDYGGVGIISLAGSVIEGNSVFSCAGGGIDSSSSTVIANNAIESNGGVGIDAVNGSLIVNNTVRGSADEGIRAAGDCLVRGNAVDNDFIRVLGSHNTIDSNSVTDAPSTGAIDVDNSDNIVIRNVLSGGGIVAVGGNTVATVVSGAAINSAGPFANISH